MTTTTAATTTTTTTTATMPTPTAPKASKLVYDRMKRDVINKSLKAAGIERVPLENGVPAKVALAKDAQALQAFYLAKLASPEGQALELMVCDPADGGCGGESPGDLVGCPFCGTGDAAAEEKESEAKEKKPPKDRPSTKGKLALARAVEREAERLLGARHADRALRANVEFYTAVILDAVGIDRAAFTPTFAVGRVVGWCAHIDEQRRTGRLIRPASRYVGPMPT